jgi:hypothetical protein
MLVAHIGTNEEKLMGKTTRKINKVIQGVRLVYLATRQANNIESADTNCIWCHTLIDTGYMSEGAAEAKLDKMVERHMKKCKQKP